MSNLGMPFTVDENSPSCLMIDPIIEIDLDSLSTSGVTSTDTAMDALFEYYIMYSEEPVRDRFSINFDNGNTDNFISVVIELATGEWRALSNANNPLNALPFTLVDTDILVAQQTALGVHSTFANDGVIGGIRSVPNAGGMTIIDNSYNGSTNAGEFDLTGVFSVAKGVKERFNQDLDGNYVNESESITYTLEQAEELNAELCPEEPSTCLHYDASEPLVEYGSLQVPFAGVGTLGHIAQPPATAISFNGLAIGESVQVPLQYVGLEDRLFDVTLTITNVNGGNHTISQNTINGGFGHNGAGRYRVEFESNTFDYLGNRLPFSMAIRPASFQVGSERWWADGTSTAGLGLSPVDVYLNAGGTPVVYPATGIFGTGGSDQAARIIGYRNTTKVVAEWNSSATAGSSITTFLYEGADLVEVTVCELLDEANKRISETDDKHTKTVYSYQVTDGFNRSLWSNDESLPHDVPRNIFNGAASDPLGLPSHINGDPTESSVINSLTVVDSAVTGTTEFQTLYYGWVYIDQDNTQLQDINTNTGQRFRIWSAPLGVSPNVILERDDDTAGGDTTFGIFGIFSQGWHFIAFEMSDSAVNGGIRIQADDGNGGAFSDFSGALSSTLPVQTCREENLDYELLNSESLCPFAIPHPLASLPEQVQPLTLNSPNGTQYQLSVDNSGGIVTTAV